MKAAMNELVSSTMNLAVENEHLSASVRSESCKLPYSIVEIEHDADGPLSPNEFVNTGLHRWEEIRSNWLSSCNYTSSNSSSSGISITNRHAQDIDVDEVIDLIVSNRWRQQTPPKPASSSTSSLDTDRGVIRRNDDAYFPKPVSLPQMVDILVDLWEAEGLDM